MNKIFYNLSNSRIWIKSLICSFSNSISSVLSSITIVSFAVIDIPKGVGGEGKGASGKSHGKGKRSKWPKGAGVQTKAPKDTKGEKTNKSIIGINFIIQPYTTFRFLASSPLIN